MIGAMQLCYSLAFMVWTRLYQLMGVSQATYKRFRTIVSWQTIVLFGIHVMLKLVQQAMFTDFALLCTIIAHTFYGVSYIIINGLNMKSITYNEISTLTNMFVYYLAGFENSYSIQVYLIMLHTSKLLKQPAYEKTLTRVALLFLICFGVELKHMYACALHLLLESF